jgi:hypothetical protein
LFVAIHTSFAVPFLEVRDGANALRVLVPIGEAFVDDRLDHSYDSRYPSTRRAGARRTSHLHLGELDVIDVARRNLCHAILNFGVGGR